MARTELLQEPTTDEPFSGSGVDTRTRTRYGRPGAVVKLYQDCPPARLPILIW